jgi:hypothetical protein
MATTATLRKSVLVLGYVGVVALVAIARTTAEGFYFWWAIVNLLTFPLSIIGILPIQYLSYVVSDSQTSVVVVYAAGYAVLAMLNAALLFAVTRKLTGVVSVLPNPRR